MSEFKELAILKEKFKDKTVKEYVNEHLLRDYPFLPLDKGAYDIFCSNFNKVDIRFFYLASIIG